MLFSEMTSRGADKSAVAAKIIGGATMFKIPSGKSLVNIGHDNILSVKTILNNMNIKIISEDLGGDYARTIDFFLDNGDVKVKANNKEIKVI